MSEDIRELLTGSSAPREAERALEKAIGMQIKHLRRQHDLSIADLATQAGLSTGMLSKIENGQISPSLASLNAIATALGVPISQLFAAFEERRDASYVRSGEGLLIERRGTKVGHVYQLLGHTLRGDIVIEPYLITLKEDAVPYVGFQHEGIELLHMLSGELVYRHGEQSYEMKPGDSLMFDAASLHGPEEMRQLPAKFLSIIAFRRDPN